jgi:uncharacterized protein YndB with AHSA1/START domain
MVAKTNRRAAAVTLPTDNQILIIREFNAPRHLIFKAWTTPELIKRWWHAKRGKASVTDVDLRVGGTWRWVMITHGGVEVAFHGEYREIVPDERIVYTEVYEGIPGGDENPAVVTVTLTEVNGRTTLTQMVEVANRETRDTIINTGMEDGLQDALDLMEEVAISLA